MSSRQPAQLEAASGALDALRRLWVRSLPGHESSLHLNAATVTSLNAVFAALRWGAVMIGLSFAATRAADGNIRVVLTLSVVIFITSWRTIAPIRLGELRGRARLRALGDVAVLSLAIGPSEGLTSPFLGAVLVAIAVAGFGWGVALGIASTVIAMALTTMSAAITSAAISGVPMTTPGPIEYLALAGVAVVPGIALDRLADIERRRRVLVRQRDKLAETNQLLQTLTGLARTLPSSLDLSDVVTATRIQLSETFGTEKIVIAAYEEGQWSPLYQEGFSLPPQLRTDALPPALYQAARASDVINTGSGLYCRLVVSGFDVGLVAVEHVNPGRYTDADAEMLRGMSDVLALTLANARSFRRLRSLAAAEERSRIARDLHDRLGQYLTYIALELERINNERDQPSPELKELHDDVQGAISEFRDTLIELRASVTSDRPLTVVLSEVVERFRKRSSADVVLDVPSSLDRLPAIIENELLRIAQEALVNVEKHARANEVRVTWSIDDRCGLLVVSDDGRGFDPSKGIRGSAYGLVGMRERAASVGATLEVSSEPGHGTVVTVQTSQTSEQVMQP